LLHGIIKKRSGRYQGGATLLLVVVGLLALVTAFITAKLLEVAEGKVQRAGAEKDNLEFIRQALVVFAATNKRLPCPASGAAMTGVEDRTTGSSTCNSPTGVVPWSTLNIPIDARTNAQGRLISYRVFAGVTGLTQDDGASMVNCDTVQPTPATLPTSGLCLTTHDHTPSQFMLGKGLTVDNMGVSLPSIAFVLIDHGKTGYGSWGPNGARMTSAATNSLEWFNSEANPQLTFYQREAATTVEPSDANHFDDQIVYMAIAELIERTGLKDRDWPEPPDPTTTALSAATTANMGTFAEGQNSFAASSGSGAFTASGDTLRVGGASGTYSRCLWWPNKQQLYFPSTALKRNLRAVMTFGYPTSGDVGNGFVLGILSGASTLTSTPCGTSSSSTGNTTGADIGWGGGTFATTDRFAVEIDLTRNTGYSDPTGTQSTRHAHSSIVFAGTDHDGLKAPACPSRTTTWGATCFHPNIVNWLRSGSSSSNLLRMEIEPRSAACSAGAAPQLRAWLMQYSICAANSAICGTLANLSTAASTTQGDYPTGTAYLTTCLPAPASVNAYDSIYFGMTTTNANTNATVNLYINSLQFSTY
jgi:hypothetical protein